ncbi:hypothetical protein BN961_00332 [Afipia felis]|uniref:Type I restriction enzyme R protein N-terminal domain-containing protein n=1 Tax=Afipia felis TaxID=1035 RepID=A0A090MH96_AFIFE|nr:hypothetical protein [Afipia felis]CEG06951.1 hypothetical protein BN961_00332 [Afipia felis]
MAEKIEALSNKKESEQQVALRVREILAAQIPDYLVESGRSILYRIEIDTSGQVTYDNADRPKRGQYAFQTDIAISKDGLPLVVIELKSGSFSSHDVITYSWKASRHKQIYPFLRYGFVVVASYGLGRRFATHNEGFDFAMALPNEAAIEIDLAALVKRQIESAERLKRLMGTTRMKIRRFEQTVEIDH